MNIKLDENVHGDVAATLTSLGHNVATDRDQSLAETTDIPAASRSSSPPAPETGHRLFTFSRDTDRRAWPIAGGRRAHKVVARRIR